MKTDGKDEDDLDKNVKERAEDCKHSCILIDDTGTAKKSRIHT